MSKQLVQIQYGQEENNLLDVCVTNAYKDAKDNQIDTTYATKEENELSKTTDIISGNNPNVNNSANAPLIYGKINGYTEQKTLTGKNLFSASLENVNLVPIDNFDYITNDINPFTKGAGNYYFSCTGDFGTAYVIWCYDSEDNCIINSRTGKLIITEELANSVVKTVIAIEGLTSGTNYTGNIYPMITYEDSDDTYEPYCGNIPSPNPDYPQEIQGLGDSGTIEVKTCGKNLANPNNFIIGKVVDYTSGNILDNTSYSISGYIEIEPNATYTKQGFTEGMENWVYDSNKNPISAIVANTFETPSNAKYVVLSYLNSNTSPRQLEEGTVVTPYEPYTETTAIIPIDTLYEGDYLEVYADGSGKIVQENDTKVFNGSEYWFLNKEVVEGVNLYLLSKGVTGITYTPESAKSNLYLYDKYYHSSDLNKDRVFCIDLNNIIIRDNAFTSVTEFKTFLGSNNFHIVYKREEPVETPLTAEQVQAFKQLYTFNNVTNFFCDGEITARYYVNTNSGDTVGMLQGMIPDIEAGENVVIEKNDNKITISSTDTKYTHPTTSGNKHIPSGGSSGQILRWAADGTAVWGADNSATKAEVSTLNEVLTSRMDSFTKLEEGSTTGDAELVDARIDYKGTTYENVGAHIREATSQLSNDLVNVSNISTEELMETFDLTPSSAVGITVTPSNNNKTFTISGKAKYDYVYNILDNDNTSKLLPNHKYYVSFESDKPLYANFQIISDFPSNVIIDTPQCSFEQIEIPIYARTVTVRLYLKTDIEDCTCHISIKEIRENEEILIGTNVFKKENIFDGTYVDYITGIYIPLDSYFSTYPIDTHANNLYEISGLAGGSQIAYYDKNNNYIFGELVGEKSYIKIPNDDKIKYFVICTANACKDEFSIVLTAESPILTVDNGGSILETLKTAYQIGATKVIVESGEYDIIAEYKNYYGNDYFDKYTNYDESYRGGDKFTRGLWLENIEIVFSSGAKVICKYDGTNENVEIYFSAFATGDNVVIDGLALNAENLRYGIHSDYNLTSDFTFMTIKNCDFTFKNSRDVYQSIGAGLGEHVLWTFENCIFRCSANEPTLRIHNHVSANAHSKIIVKGCYIEGSGYFLFNSYSTSAEITTILMSNCSYITPPVLGKETENSNVNMELLAWNNVQRN